MAKLRESFRPGTLHSMTREILRRAGPDGEAILKREKEFVFLWDHAWFGSYGLAHVLHCIHRGDFQPKNFPNAIADGPCLALRESTSYPSDSFTLN